MSVWADNEPKSIHPQDPYKIYVLFRFLDQVIDMKQENTDRATGLK